MSSFRWISWEQPKLKGNKDYGEVSASSVNSASAAPAWKASDGIKEGTNTSWEAARDVCPASWLWKLPVTLRITKLVLYNKYSGYTNVTKDITVYSDEEKRQKICQGSFTDAPFSTLVFPFEEPVITNTLCVVCENGHYNPGCFIGLGEVEITAEQGVQQYTVQYVDWDGTILKSATVDKGDSVEPPPAPTRQGYTFIGWDASSERVVSDMLIAAQYEKIPSTDDFLLTVLTNLIGGLNIPLETGVFKGKAPDRYIVLTPLSDTLELFANNRPGAEIQEVRISLFDKGNYLKTKNQLTRSLLNSDITITDRRFIGHEDNTGYYHYAIDVAKNYELED